MSRISDTNDDYVEGALVDSKNVVPDKRCSKLLIVATQTHSHNVVPMSVDQYFVL